MKYWGAAIPGLTMNALDLPEIPGLLRLNNPEVGTGEKIGRWYTIEEVALCHLKTLKKHEHELEENFTLMGMSMGGMILSILATEHRAQLPKRCQFRFIVTSANLPECPALPIKNLIGWMTLLPRTPEKMERLLKSSFGPEYRKKNPEKLKEYFHSLANGGNEQTLIALVRQIHALRDFNGRKYFPKINPLEAVFIGGGSDSLLGPKHSALLKTLVPKAIHREIPEIGHMIHLEAPEVFSQNYSI